MSLLRHLIGKSFGSQDLDPLVELQYQTMVGTAPKSLPLDALEKPELVEARNGFRQIEAIEAELNGETDGEVVLRLLEPFFSRRDPWLKARAAKAIYRLAPERALTELQHLAENSSPHVQLPAIWGLGELATPRALDLLLPLAWSSQISIQQAAIRCLLQLENKRQIPAASIGKVKQLLIDLRAKTDWII